MYDFWLADAQICNLDVPPLCSLPTVILTMYVTVKLLIQAGSRIEAGSLIQAGGIGHLF